MKNKFFGFIILLFTLSFMCSCTPYIPPKTLTAVGNTFDETIDNFIIARDKAFSISNVEYELKDFYATYYIPNFDNLSKYDAIATTNGSSSSWLFEIIQQLVDDQVSYDRFADKYIDDYYLMGTFYTQYKFTISDLENQYSVSVSQSSNNCYSSIKINEDSIFYERSIYAIDGENNDLLTLDFLIKYADSNDKFEKIYVVDNAYYITDKGEKIFMFGTHFYITPVFNFSLESEESKSYFMYKDFLYLFSDDYSIPASHEILNLKLKEFYDDLVFTREKKDIYIEK